MIVLIIALSVEDRSLDGVQRDCTQFPAFADVALAQMREIDAMTASLEWPMAGPGPRCPRAFNSSAKPSASPTISDRVAQTVARMVLEPKVEPFFHPDSYGYRPGRSALDAVGVARKRCWAFDWVIDSYCPPTHEE
jgi:hypothetical protein